MSVALPSVLAVALVTGWADTARAADPQPLGEVSGACVPGAFSSEYQLPATPENHPSTILRVAVNGPVWWAAHDIQITGADTIWDDGGSVDAGVPVSGYVDCMQHDNVAYTVTQFDTPSAPTRFSGSSTPGGSDESSGDPFGSNLSFRAPGDAPYVADVTVSQGAVNVTADMSASTTVASQRTVTLGALDAGEHTVSLVALDGPQAIWQVTIRPLPIAVSGLAVGRAVARPRQANTLAYTTSGQTRITVTVLNGASDVVRTLARDLAVGRGDHELTWDGTTQGGARLRDGSYRLLVQSVDPVGNASQAATPVIVDGTPPRVRWPRSKRLKPRQRIIVKVTDRLAGVRSARLMFAGRTVARLHRGTHRINYHPGRGYRWRPGRVRYTLISYDRAGNRTRASHTFRVKR